MKEEIRLITINFFLIIKLLSKSIIHRAIHLEGLTDHVHILINRYYESAKRKSDIRLVRKGSKTIWESENFDRS